MSFAQQGAPTQRTGLRESLAHFFRKGHRRDYAWLLALLSVCLFFLLSPYLRESRSLMRVTDGTEQHYLFFVYIGEWARGIVGDLLSGKGLNVPVWNMSMGYGADMITTMAAYIADPFNWISVLFPKWLSETAFNASIVLRYYAAGLVFLAYCHHRGYDRASSVVASLAYATCGVTFVITTESFLENPMVLFPLVLWGLDKVFDGESPLMFILAVGASFANYFYFGYMICLLLIPFFIAHFVDLGATRRTPREFVRLMSKSLLFCFLGIALSSVILVPVLKVVLATGRISADRPLDVLYDASYYKGLIGGWTSFFYAGPDSYIGFTYLSVVGIATLFLCRGEFRGHKLLLVVLTTFLLFPVFGKLFNGFAYVTNRWSWGYAFLSAEVVACALPKLTSLQPRQKRTLLTVLGTYAALVLALALFPNPAKPHVAWAASSVILAIFIICNMAIDRQHADNASSLLPGSLALLLVIYAAMMGPSIYTKNVLNAAQVRGKALPDLTENHASQVIKQLPDSTNDWRYDNLDRRIRNSSLAQNLKSYDFYISMYNERVDRLHSDLGLRGAMLNVSYTDLDGRPYLEYAMGTKYIVSPTSSKRPTSSFYKEISRETVGAKEYNLYEGAAYKPIANLQSSVFDTQQFLKMGMVEREAALAQGVFVDDSTKVNSTPEQITTDVDFSISPGKRALLNDNGDIEVPEKDSTLTISLQAPQDHAVYLELTDFSLEPISNEVSNITARINNGTAINRLTILTPASHMSGGKKNWVVFLGEGSGQQMSVDLEFQKPGTYKVESIDIKALPLSYLRDAATIGSSPRSDVTTEFGTNSICCEVNHESDEMLVVTTPYSDGWKASIDGADAEIEIANTAFMAVPVPAGSHTVTLRYNTPGLIVGAVISIGSLCCSVAIHFTLFRRNRNQRF